MKSLVLLVYRTLLCDLPDICDTEQNQRPVDQWNTIPMLAICRETYQENQDKKKSGGRKQKVVPRILIWLVEVEAT